MDILSIGTAGLSPASVAGGEGGSAAPSDDAKANAASPPKPFGIELATGRVRPLADKPPSQ